MIHYIIPWNTGKNVGAAYNTSMHLVGESDFVCFLDADACFTTSFFGKQLEDIVRKYPESGFFTCYTNRVGCPWQLYGDPKTNDMKYHREVGLQLFNNYYDSVTQIQDPVNAMSGVLILISKKVWRDIGGFRENGMLGIDNEFYFKALSQNQIMYRMNGVYVYHWYRGGDFSRSIKSTKHLLK